MKELNLNNNEIEDISPLENCNFENLEKFDIEENKLDNNILLLKKHILNFQSLKLIYLIINSQKLKFLKFL